MILTSRTKKSFLAAQRAAISRPYTHQRARSFRDLKKCIDRRGLAGDDYLFQMIAPTNTIDCQKYVQAYRVKRKDPNFECTLHLFRHSRARRLVMLGVELPTIQRFMRHKNLITAQQYVMAVEDNILNMRNNVGNLKPYFGMRSTQTETDISS